MWKSNERTILTVFVGVIIFVLLAVVMMQLIPVGYGIDWVYVYRPAALALLQGENPYEAAQFFAAPWGLILLLVAALFTMGLSPWSVPLQNSD